MRKTIKKFLTIALAATVAVSAFTPVTAKAADVPSSMTIYRTSKSGTSNTSIYISNLKKSATIKKSSVKSSDKKVATINYLNKDTYNSTYNYKYYNGSKDNTYKNSYANYYISLSLKKAGTSTISYKLDGKTYKTKVTVKNYTNPLKSVKISGISGNLAGKLKKQNSAKAKLKKSPKNATVKLTANKNWKITGVSLSTVKKIKQDGGTSYSTQEQYSYYAYNGGKSSATLRVGNLSKKNAYQVNVNMVNTKTGGSLYCTYNINY
ncbi:MAG: hypothetical protein IJ429_01245 [Lachnospiraceae bacterium]|nr:hypothetical protein [Lachnospiraceae bacterium]